MARFRKIDPRFWRDESVRKLTPHEKLLAAYLLTAQANRIGIYYLSLGLASEECGYGIDTVSKGLFKLENQLGWRFEKINSVIFLPKWWYYNQPPNMKAFKGALTDLHEVPQSPLIKDFVRNKLWLDSRFHGALDTVCDTVSIAKSELAPGAGAGAGAGELDSPNGESSTEPPRAAAVATVAGFDFPVVGRGAKVWSLPEAKLAEYRDAFPGIDLEAELRKALQWCRDAGTKRKTFKGMPSFLGRWLARAQNDSQRPVMFDRSHKPTVQEKLAAVPRLTEADVQ